MQGDSRRWETLFADDWALNWTIPSGDRQGLMAGGWRRNPLPFLRQRGEFSSVNWYSVYSCAARHVLHLEEEPTVAESEDEDLSEGVGCGPEEVMQDPWQEEEGAVITTDSAVGPTFAYVTTETASGPSELVDKNMGVDFTSCASGPDSPYGLDAGIEIAVGPEVALRQGIDVGAGPDVCVDTAVGP